MQLTAPNLDDRTYRDLVDEALRRIPAYIEGWSTPTPSDPGVTLVELFAWLTEIILYRQNQMPDWLTVKMMQLFGMRLEEPKAAQTEVTFQLSTPPKSEKVTIDMGTEVATTQTETQPSIIFSTDQKLTIHSAQLKRLLQYRQNDEEALTSLDVNHVQEPHQTVRLFSQLPTADDALYFGFDDDMSHHLLHLYFSSVQSYGTDGIDTLRPPYVWEGAALDENGAVIWQKADLEHDETRGLLLPGRMMIHLPTLHHTAIEIDADTLYWIRLRVLGEGEYPDRFTRPFTQSPRVNQITANSMGGTVSASHAEQIEEAFLGYSDGSPGQRFYLQFTPLLKPDANRGETVTVRIPAPNGTDSTQEETWVWVPAFGDADLEQTAPLYDADEAQKHAFESRRIFTLDTASGELRFPPAQTDATGQVQRYGMIPSRQSAIWFNQYRHGGGVNGNVDAYALDTLKTAIPHVNRVYNRKPAKGGKDQEPLEIAKLRAPAMLHARDRAVTAADFEYLATRANVALGRVKCLQHEPGIVESIDPGVVYIFVLPEVENPQEPLSPGKLTMSRGDLQQIHDYLNQRRLLTMRLQVDQPEIIWVRVKLTCRVMLGANKKGIENEVGKRLHHYLNPLVGGREQSGWPFSRELTTYDVYACIQGIDGVLAFPEITLMRQLPKGNQPAVKGLVPVPDHGVIALAGYDVQFVR